MSQLDEHVRTSPGADPAATTIVGSTATAPSPSGAERYTLGEEIARGGMGAVYRASDNALGRVVAIKVLQEKYAPDVGTTRRFLDEARITSQLQHPGIPPVHDVGTLPDGRPFLAMKLIKGNTLDALLENRPDPAAERGRYVAVFEQVCQAVGYAHAHGVVHRDLKPSNVMVGAFGEVQVMDWGLAKVLGPRATEAGDPQATRGETKVVSLRDSDGSFTQAGSVMGTPAFMPPEQAVGAVDQIDARSDVFGLGGILAMILTARPPFLAATAESTRQLAARGKVQACFARLDACGADPELVALCKRCLAAEKEDRPADASAVAEAVAALRTAAEERARRAEVERVRAEGERASAELRVAEQRRRMRLRLALAGLAGVLLVAGGSFAWYTDRQTTAERSRRGRTAEAVASLLDQAEAALRGGDGARAGVVLEAAAQRAEEGGAEEQADRLARLGADLTALREMDAADRLRWTTAKNRRQTEAAAARYRAALAGLGADPLDIPPEAVAARLAGSVVRDRLVAALDWILWEERSQPVRAVLKAVDPDPYRDAARQALAVRDQTALAELTAQAGAAEQPAAFVAVLGETGSIPVETRRRLLTAAIRRRPENLGLLLAIAYAYPSGQRVGADERARWAQAAVAVAPDNPIPHINLGIALADLGDSDGAIAEYREALRLAPTLIYPLNNLGNVLASKGNLDGAIANYREALRLDPTYASAHNGLGSALQEKGDLDGAIASFQEAIRLDGVYLAPHFNLGIALSKQGDWDGAIAKFRTATRLAPWFAPAHNNLGDALHRTGDRDAAIPEYREGIRLDPKRPNPHNNLGNALFDQGDLDGALAEYKEALRLDPKHAQATRNVARLERLRPLIPRLPAVLTGTDQPATPAERVHFAELCRQHFQRRYAAAVRLYTEAFAADPSLADAHRYDAACCAIRAAAGEGVDAPADSAERVALRAAALGWLRADLAVRQKQAASSSASDRRAAAGRLTDWVQNADLAVSRSEAVRAGLSDGERADWDALWAAARAALTEARKPVPQPASK